jgi:hypothetical protein
MSDTDSPTATDAGQADAQTPTKSLEDQLDAVRLATRQSISAQDAQKLDGHDVGHVAASKITPKQVANLENSRAISHEEGGDILLAQESGDEAGYLRQKHEERRLNQLSKDAPQLDAHDVGRVASGHADPNADPSAGPFTGWNKDGTYIDSAGNFHDPGGVTNSTEAMDPTLAPSAPPAPAAHPLLQDVKGVFAHPIDTLTTFEAHPIDTAHNAWEHLKHDLGPQAANDGAYGDPGAEGIPDPSVLGHG